MGAEKKNQDHVPHFLFQVFVQSSNCLFFVLLNIVMMKKSGSKDKRAFIAFQLIPQWTWTCVRVRKQQHQKRVPRDYMTSLDMFPTSEQRILMGLSKSPHCFAFLRRFYAFVSVAKRWIDGLMMMKEDKKKPKFTTAVLVWSRSVIMDGCELCGRRSEKDGWFGLRMMKRVNRFVFDEKV